MVTLEFHDGRHIAIPPFRITGVKHINEVANLVGIVEPEYSYFALGMEGPNILDLLF